MALAFKRIMIVTHNVKFAIDTKLALESLGDYAVTTVTNANTAIDSLQNQPHNLILLDVENLEMPAPEVINTIRKIQSDIAIVLAPDMPDAHDLALTTDVQGIVDLPIPIRQLIPVFENSVRDIYDNLPDTVKAPAIDISQETVYIETLVDELLENDETPYFTSRQIQAQKRNLLDDMEHTTEPHQTSLEVIIESGPEGETVRYVGAEKKEYGDRSIQLFKRLAEEEPPMPDMNESGTISDLARSVTQSDKVPVVDNEVETEARSMDNVDIEDVDDESDSGSIPAILVLQTALDETTPLEAISLQTLYDNIQNRLPPEKQTIRPLPSWLKESEKFVREPVFLEENLVPLDTQRPLEYTSTTTQPSDGTVVVSDASDLETEVIESGTYADEPDLEELEAVVEASEPEPDDVDAELEDAEEAGDAEEAVAPPVADETVEESVMQEASADVPQRDELKAPEADARVEEADTVSPVQSDDPYVVQLATTLTQVSTELTAEATILTRDKVIVAYSGDMPMEDIDDLRMVIKDDWSASLDNARIRFITLPSSGKDYMLYSKGTVGNFTLSMIFAGTKQLRIIRRQGNRLSNALESVTEVAIPSTETVPEAKSEVDEDTPDVAVAPLSPQEVMGFDSDEPYMETESEEVEPVDVGPTLPFTFIWLVDDIEVRLSTELAKKLVFWLEVQLNSLHWTIYTLDVHQDFIYLYADVPGDLSPATLIRSLMERSEKIALSEDDSLPDALWADAYLVLKPGREMTSREIQRFLNFARDEG